MDLKSFPEDGSSRKKSNECNDFVLNVKHEEAKLQIFLGGKRLEVMDPKMHMEIRMSM